MLGESVTALGVVRCLGRRGIRALRPGPHGDYASWSRWSQRLPLELGSPPSADGARGLSRAASRGAGGGRSLLGRLDPGGRASCPDSVRERFPSTVPSPDAVGVFLDKAEFAALLEREGVPHPRTIVSDDAEALTGWANDVVVGVLPEADRLAEVHAPLRVQGDARGRSRRDRGEAGRGRERGDRARAAGVRARPDLVALLRRRLCQPWTDASPARLARRRLRMYPPDFGNSTYHVTVPFDEVADAADELVRLLASVGYRGIFSAEFKRDERDGVLKLLEVNVRPWWYVEFAALCGVDVCHLAYREALGLPDRAARRLSSRRTLRPARRRPARVPRAEEPARARASPVAALVGRRLAHGVQPRPTRSPASGSSRTSEHAACGRPSAPRQLMTDRPAAEWLAGRRARRVGAVRRCVPDGERVQPARVPEVLAAVAGGRFRVLAVRKGDELVGGLSVYETTTPLGPRVQPRLLLFYNGLVLREETTVYPGERASRELRVVTALAEALEQEGYRRVELRTRAPFADGRVVPRERLVGRAFVQLRRAARRPRGAVGADGAEPPPARAARRARGLHARGRPGLRRLLRAARDDARAEGRADLPAGAGVPALLRGAARARALPSVPGDCARRAGRRRAARPARASRDAHRLRGNRPGVRRRRRDGVPPLAGLRAPRGRGLLGQRPDRRDAQPRHAVQESARRHARDRARRVPRRPPRPTRRCRALRRRGAPATGHGARADAWGRPPAAARFARRSSHSSSGRCSASREPRSSSCSTACADPRSARSWRRTSSPRRSWRSATPGHRAARAWSRRFRAPASRTRSRGSRRRDTTRCR